MGMILRTFFSLQPKINFKKARILIKMQQKKSKYFLKRYEISKYVGKFKHITRKILKKFDLRRRGRKNMIFASIS